MSADWTLLEGDVLEHLRELPDEHVQCVVTSPPYFGLRDYELPPTAWGDGWVGCLGLEPTPEQYVAHLVEVMDEVRRVLRPDGLMWLNLGDSYARGAGKRDGNFGRAARGVGIPETRDSRKVPPGLKPKDLIGVPWMVAFALRSAGWWLRADDIWFKPNAMPASVDDRTTRAHEYLFLLTRSERYFYDAFAIREADSGRSSGNGFSGRQGGAPTRMDGGEGSRQAFVAGSGRNKRSVWTVATIPYPDAHFATFPPALVQPAVLAGSAMQACSLCGAPWERIIEREDTGYDGSRYGERAVAATGGAIGGGTARSTLGSSNGRLVAQPRSVGWRPTCAHSEGGGALSGARSLRGHGDHLAGRGRARTRRAWHRALPKVRRAGEAPNGWRHVRAVRRVKP